MEGVISASFASKGDDFRLIKKRGASEILKHDIDDELLATALNSFCDDDFFEELILTMPRDALPRPIMCLRMIDLPQDVYAGKSKTLHLTSQTDE